MDNSEKYLRNLRNNDIYIPNKFTNSIKNSLNNKNIKKYKLFNVKRKIAACFTALILTGSAVFATTHFNLFDLSSFGKNSSGLNKAAENGYIQNISMNYIQTSNLSYKATYLLMDDKNFDLGLNLKFNDNISNYQGFHISNINITDENNNLIYSENGNFEGSDDLETSMGWKVINKDTTNNSIEQLLFLDGKNFPKSKKLYITFNDVVLYNTSNGKPITKKIEGSYKLIIDVDNIFSNRQNIQYIPKENVQNKDIKFNTAELSSTGFTVDFTSNLNDISQIKLIDNNNKEYSISNSYQEDTSLPKSKLYEITFDLTQYDKPNNVYLYIIESNNTQIKIPLIKQ